MPLPVVRLAKTLTSTIIIISQLQHCLWRGRSQTPTPGAVAVAGAVALSATVAATAAVSPRVKDSRMPPRDYGPSEHVPLKNITGEVRC